jgi:hypothetical protein
MVGRFILRFRSQGSPGPAQLAEVDALHGVKVLDRTPRMLFVEGEESVLQSFVDSVKGWVLIPETSYRLPDSRYKPVPH